MPTVSSDINALLIAANDAAALVELGAAKAADLSTVGGANKTPKFDPSGNLVTGPFVNASVAFGNEGNIHIPNIQGIRWLKKDGTQSNAQIWMWQDHDANGGELIVDSPWRIALIPKGPIQMGPNDPGVRYATPMLMSSGYADVTYTARESMALCFQTSTFTGGVNTRNYINVQGVPLDTTGTNSVLRVWDQASVVGIDGGGVAADRGKVTGNLIAEIYKEGIWSPGTAPEFLTLTDGATITLTCSKYKTVQVAKVTLGGNRTLALSGTLAGMRGILYVKQDATGNRTLALPAGSIASASFALSTAANTYDRLSWEFDGTNYFWIIENGLVAAIDADAQTFLTRASISDNAQKYAVDSLVVALKTNNLWAKFYAIYPFVGGNATAHAQNLIANLYNGTFGGTVTHNAHATGTITGDGSTGWFDTNFNFAAVSAVNSVHCYAYCRTELPTDGGYLFGATGSDSSRVGLHRTAGNIGNAGVNANYAAGSIAASSDFRKHFWQGRYDASNSEMGLNATTAGIANSSLSACNADVFILARNTSGTAGLFSAANIGLAAFGQTLNSTERATFRTIIDNFQTALGRANP